VRVL